MMDFPCPNCASENTEYIDNGDWFDCHCLICDWVWSAEIWQIDERYEPESDDE